MDMRSIYEHFDVLLVSINRIYSKPLATLQYKSIIKRSAAAAASAVVCRSFFYRHKTLLYQDVVTNKINNNKYTFTQIDIESSDGLLIQYGSECIKSILLT